MPKGRPVVHEKRGDDWIEDGGRRKEKGVRRIRRLELAHVARVYERLAFEFMASITMR